MIEAWFDGACEPINPGGTASWGIVIKKDGEVIYSNCGIVGSGSEMSNNVAEYAGLIRILELLAMPSGRGFMVEQTPVVIRGDSQLVINQMRGFWRAKGGLYFSYHLKAQDLYHELLQKNEDITFKWIPREENEECDRLSRSVGVRPTIDLTRSDAAQKCPGNAGEQPGGRVEPTS